MQLCHIHFYQKIARKKVARVNAAFPSFGIQLDETTDVGSEAQLLVFCRFPDVELNKISEH